MARALFQMLKRLSLEPRGGCGGVVQDRRRKLLVIGEHTAAEDEGGNLGHLVVISSSGL
jgi:hypothetical protein